MTNALYFQKNLYFPEKTIVFDGIHAIYFIVGFYDAVVDFTGIVIVTQPRQDRFEYYILW
jgi:hypothetical protein